MTREKPSPLCISAALWILRTVFVSSSILILSSRRAPQRHWARLGETKLVRALCTLQVVICLSLPPCSVVNAQTTKSTADGFYFPAPLSQAEADEYTRYELLAPETASFKIHYEVTATTAGARFFYNPIRKGSSATDEAVYDAMLGTPLHFGIVSGAE